jgi:S-methylmethionine-dependent homocysteine/selenocysteine methylase
VTTKSNPKLPRPGGPLYLTDGGIETWLICHDGLELPEFAAFVLLRSPEGSAALRAYFERHVKIAVDRGTGFVFESPTWRASPDWGDMLGYGREDLAAANREAIAMLRALQQAHETETSPMVVSGCIGPRGDGYVVGEAMTADEAQDYHAYQVEALSDADLVTGITMTNVPEAIGLARAAEAGGMPAAISFTVETDACLPDGTPIGEAIMAVDTATGASPLYYMINCAHPTHFAAALEAGGDWVKRIGGLRANASKLSHEELDAAEELDEGDPVELGADHAALHRMLPHIAVLGGCCGTDHRHVEAICAAVQAEALAV